MNSRRHSVRRFLRLAACCGTCALICSSLVLGQSQSNERAFSQSRNVIEKALKNIQPAMSGRLPILDGFAKPGDHPLDQYSRAYFQSSVEVKATPSGASIVRVTTKVTAWYKATSTSQSGYQLLSSNGRIESDILDQLADQLSGGTETASANSEPAAGPTRATEPSAPEPVRKFPDAAKTLPASLGGSLNSDSHTSDRTPEKSGVKKSADPLKAEADNLEEILKNTAHPKNLVAVKKSGTPVVPTPSLTAKPQFLASLHDEFEMLDFNADWVHVRISGLSRGWIWRNSVEMPEGIPDTETHLASAASTAADLFHVTREETAPFPGDWAPLRTKTVKIITVQKVDESAKDNGQKERLEFAKFLLEKNYAEVAKKPEELQGVVVIFDSADGGMIAATAATLQQWKAGALSDSALWHKCFFDPPETFDSGSPTGSQ